jgi:hypothetical protein
MNNNQMQTPIAFILFNRPEKTRQSFEQIAKAKPAQLFLIADGPRPNHPTDAENCAAARAVVENIDWDCTVYRNYSDTNLGCKRRVSSGIDWVFEQVEEAIIIEDDVVVGPDFFQFVEAMLACYRHDTRIMHIAGFNELLPDPTYPYSYFFSRKLSVWGWATWRRAWQYYDVTMSLWPSMRERLANQLMLSPRLVKNLDATFSGEIDTWDYQWFYTMALNSGFAVIPATNLIQNIGFGPDATHTWKTSDPRATVRPGQLALPLRSPPYVMVESQYETSLTVGNKPKPFGCLFRRLAKVKRIAKAAMGRAALG